LNVRCLPEVYDGSGPCRDDDGDGDDGDDRLDESCAVRLTSLSRHGKESAGFVEGV